MSNGVGQHVAIGLIGKPTTIVQGNELEAFSYDVGGNRYLRMHADGRRTFYLDGGNFEYRLPAPADSETTAKMIVQVRVGSYSPKVQVDTTNINALD